MGRAAERPWWLDLRGRPPEPKWAKDWRDRHQVGPGEIVSPTWVNLAVVILSAGIFVANVWGFGLFPGLIWGLAPCMFIALLAPGERRWRGRHPGVRPETTPVHIAFVVLYALNLAVIAFLAARGGSKPSGTSLGQILPQVVYLGFVLWVLTRNLRRQRRIWEHTQAGHPPNGAE